MTIRKTNKLTLEAFISSPRRSPAIPNDNGTLALYTLSTYSLESHSEGKEIRVLDLFTGKSTLFSDDAKNKDVAWLQDEQVLWLREGEGGVTEVWCGFAVGEKNAYLMTTIDGPASNLRTKKLSNKFFAVAVTGKASPDGTFFNPETAEKPRLSAREYDKLPVRIWDHYMTAEKNSIWYTRLDKHENRYSISSVGFINALQGTGLEHPNQDPLFAGNFDLSAKGILLTAIDPAVDQALLFENELYHIPVQTFTEDPAPPAHKISIPDYDGSAISAKFSPDGKSAAFLRIKEAGNDYDQPRIFLMRDTDNVDSVTELTTSDSWDLQPQSLTFGSDAKTLYLTAEDCGRRKLFKILVPEEATYTAALPTPITSWGSISSVHAISTTLLLVTLSSLTESSIFAAVDLSTGTLRQISRHTNYSSSHFATSPSQVSDIHFPGAGPYDVQAFVVKPSSFSPRKKYPLLFWIHGGPVSAFLDEWSTRWNPAVFAEQGYVVVLPNPTGSTGFGQDFVDAIKGDWGGRPYQDLVNCFDHVKKELGYVDTDRAVAMGGSYGGYMVNWIAGQPLAKKFKALVCHDGIFSLPNMLASDEISSLWLNFGGTLWENPDAWKKWDPSRHTARWDTPMLVIHSEWDFRCPITEGLAAFGVCQAKGVESKFLSFQDEGHWVLGRENSLRWHRTVTGWCDRFCGGGVERGSWSWGSLVP
ncbi:MAG: hypothetical protein ALECFALPRED_000266 [Alectoria fallacina]|uniref:Dipeptidyl-peptidase V n=1 Tax=Alectoria fallacina TaxID=1903189 RepID=A0A8H3JAG5_9LECA|nr:MAG: hypothetical protein ALECFALPRED_000266 [Alectoria fallacina]